MKTLSLVAVMVTLLPTSSAGPAAAPLQVAPTSTGCTVTLSAGGEEFRVDSLAGGGVLVTLHDETVPPGESHSLEGCISGYRISSAANGTGSLIEIRPAGVEFAGVIRSAGRLQLLFEKVGEIGGGSSPPGERAQLYTIGVGDSLKITVFGQSDLTKEAKVAPDGSITYSLLGSVQVAGKTVAQVQDELRAALGKQYIVNPQVSVDVQQYGSAFVYLNGLVKTPGRYPIEGGITLKDALSLAGGLSPDAGYTIAVARRAVGPDGRERSPETTRFARADIEAGRANMNLLPGDVVTVGEKDYFFIQDQVRHPGKYEIGPGITILGAISVAEGLTDWANPKKISLIRVVEGKTITQTINYKDIVNQKRPDVPLVGGDIVIVPKRTL